MFSRRERGAIASGGTLDRIENIIIERASEARTAWWRVWLSFTLVDVERKYDQSVADGTASKLRQNMGRMQDVCISTALVDENSSRVSLRIEACGPWLYQRLYINGM